MKPLIFLFFLVQQSQIVLNLLIGLGMFFKRFLKLKSNFRRINKRIIYVVETLKRPVPLEHFLYCGQDGKTRNDIFLIFDTEGNFKNSGYFFYVLNFELFGDKKILVRILNSFRDPIFIRNFPFFISGN